jgi:hypothetical protein
MITLYEIAYMVGAYLALAVIIAIMMRYYFEEKGEN